MKILYGIKKNSINKEIKEYKILKETKKTFKLEDSSTCIVLKNEKSVMFNKYEWFFLTKEKAEDFLKVINDSKVKVKKYYLTCFTEEKSVPSVNREIKKTNR